MKRIPAALEIREEGDEKGWSILPLRPEELKDPPGVFPRLSKRGPALLLLGGVEGTQLHWEDVEGC